MGDAGYELGVVALGKVAAAYGACKEYVAYKGVGDCWGVVDDVPWGVPGAVVYLQGFLPDLYGVAIGKPARGGEGVRGCKAVVGCDLGQGLYPELVGCVRADDGDVFLLCQLGCAAAVVYMAVGDEDLLQRNALLLRKLCDAFQLAARVYYGALHGLVAPDDGGVLGKCGDGYGVVVQHGCVVFGGAGGCLRGGVGRRAARLFFGINCAVPVFGGGLLQNVCRRCW